MDLRDKIKELCKEKQISMNTLETTLGFGKGYIDKLGKSTPRCLEFQQIADYFGVTIDYFNVGRNQKEFASRSSELNLRNESTKRLEAALSDLENSQDALMFSGEPLDDETRELLKASLENSIRIAKINAKQKFTPKKYEKINRGVMDLDIKKLIDNLEKKYKTRNPYELAASMNVLVIFENLGSINGYYNKQLRQKQIHINCNLPEHLQLLTCAHELGHSILHQSANTAFLKSFTYLPVDKMEIEANKFAIELLLL